jgi:hypothetical protein
MRTSTDCTSPIVADVRKNSDEWKAAGYPTTGMGKWEQLARDPILLFLGLNMNT